MRNIQLVLSYDGSHFFGWQTQPGFRTVQEVLEQAIQALTGEKVHANASGRTDTGVHAVGQVVNFYSQTHHPPDVIVRALNAHLPADVVVRAAEDMPQSFDANRDARRKLYRYVIHDGPVPDPFMRRYCFQSRRLRQLFRGPSRLLPTSALSLVPIGSDATKAMGLHYAAFHIHLSTEGAGKMRRTRLAAILLTVVSLVWVAQIARADDSKKDKDHGKDHATTHKMSDQQFILWAATRKAMERELGNLAMRKATNPDIRQFGQRVATDERQANAELLMLARRHNVQLPQQMSQQDRQTINRFLRANGSSFDHDFMQTMLKGNKHAVKVFEQEAKHAHDPQLRQFAENTLPQVKEHLKLAEQLTGQAKGHHDQGQTEESEHRSSDHDRGHKDHSNSNDHNKDHDRSK